MSIKSPPHEPPFKFHPGLRSENIIEHGDRKNEINNSNNNYSDNINNTATKTTTIIITTTISQPLLHIIHPKVPSFYDIPAPEGIAPDIHHTIVTNATSYTTIAPTNTTIALTLITITSTYTRITPTRINGVNDHPSPLHQPADQNDFS